MFAYYIFQLLDIGRSIKTRCRPVSNVLSTNTIDNNITTCNSATPSFKFELLCLITDFMILRVAIVINSLLILQVFSDDIFFGHYPHGTLSRMGGALYVTGDESVTITDSRKVEIIFNAPFDRTYGYDYKNNIFFYVQYTYAMPDGVGKCYKSTKPNDRWQN